MLFNENKVLNQQMKEQTNSTNLQIDYIERNLKSRNFEISGVPLVKNENVVDLAVKVMTKVDFQLSEEDIESAKKIKKKDNNNDLIQGTILVIF